MTQQPHSAETEKVVICAIIHDGGNESLPLLIDSGCQPDWFWKTAHRVIYEASIAIHREGDSVDEVTLINKLRRTGDLENCGGLSQINEVGRYSEVPSFRFDKHVKTLKEYAMLRHYMRFGATLLEAASTTDPGDADAFIAQKEREFYAIAENAISTESFEHVSKPALRAMENIRKAIETKGQSATGLLFGLDEIDRVMGGLRPSEVTVLAARPSVGKTALAMSLLYKVACVDKQDCLMFSLEMPSDKLIERMIFNRAKANMNKVLRQGEVTQEEQEAIGEAYREIHSAPLHIDDRPSMTIAMIAARTRRMAARLKGRKIGLVVVDYLQIVQPTDRKANREQQVAEISREFKNLIREIGCAGLMLCQINRESEKDNRPPRKSDLRESGAVEQDADCLIFLYPSLDDPPQEDLVNVNVEKNRNGQTTGSAHGKLRFIKSTASFYDMPRTWTGQYIPSEESKPDKAKAKPAGKKPKASEANQWWDDSGQPMSDKF